MPKLRLVSPSGDTWEFGESEEGGKIEGVAEEFCQVVTQVRNIDDTELRFEGEIATDWMAKA